MAPKGDVTDYTITATRRGDAGHVVYFFTDRYGQRYHITVKWRDSMRETVDRTIRHHIAEHRRRHPKP